MLAQVNSNPRLPVGSALLFNPGMNNKAVRRSNLRILEAQFGSLVALAEKTGTDPAHLSQIKNGTRAMGSRVARKIEVGMGEYDGWIDIPHDEKEALGAAVHIATRLSEQDRAAWLKHGYALLRAQEDGRAGPDLTPESTQ